MTAEGASKSATHAVVGRGQAVLLAALVLVFGLLPKFIGLTQQSLWLDELNIVRFMSFPSFDADLLAAVRNEPHPPLYIFVLWAYGKILGTSELWLRVSSAGIGAMAVLAGFFLVHREFGWKIALAFTALFGMSPTGLYEAQNVRPYSLVFLLAIISTVAFVHCVRVAGSSRKSFVRGLLVLSGTDLLLSLTHYSAVLFSAAQALYLCTQQLAERRFRRGAAIAAFLAASVVPSLAWMAWTILAYDFSATSNFRWGMFDLLSPLRAFFGQPSSLILVLFPVFVAGAAGMRTIREVLTEPITLALATTVGLHALFVVGASFVHPSWMQNKNFYVAFPSAFLLFTLALFQFTVMRTKNGLALIVLVCSATLLTYLLTGYPLHAQSFYHPFRHQTREASHLLARLSTERDTVMFGQVDMNGNGFVLEPTKVYLSLVKTLDDRPFYGTARSFSFKEKRETRLRELEEGMEEARRRGGRLFVDLPHSGQLYAEERALLEKNSFCVLAYSLERHTVLEVSFDGERCKGWKQIRTPRTLTSSKGRAAP